jgi:kelch-like protein 1/4/5
MNKRNIWLFLALLLLILVNSSSAIWVSRRAMNYPRYGLMTAAVNNKLYAIGGMQRDSAVGYVEEYNPILDTWIVKAPMPVRRGQGICGVVNGKIYCIGGNRFRNSAPMDTVDVYDPNLNQWQRRHKMPTRRQGFDGAVIGDSIYVCGGYFPGHPDFYTDTVEVYNTNRDSWFIRKSMHYPRVDFGSVSVNGKLYTISGLNNTTYLNYNEEYDPATDTWQLKAPIPLARTGLVCVTLGNKIYAIGGNRLGSSGGVYKRADVYNVIEDNWTLTDSLNIARTYAGATVINGYIFVVGGQGQNFQAVTSLEEYIPTGIEETNENYKLNVKDFSVYPNPFKYYTIFRLPNLPHQSAQIAIYDNTGKLVRTINIGYSGHVQWKGTDNEDQPLKNGVYFAKVNYNSGPFISIIKILILR